MIRSIIKLTGLTVAIVLAMVISLTFSAEAATSPTYSTQAALEDGLKAPLRIALDANGDIYVADPRSGGIVQLDKYGAVKQVIATPTTVTAVAVLNPLVSNIPGGKLLVALGDRVAVYGESGTEVLNTAISTVKFSRAAGIALDADGNIYITDTGTYNVKKFLSSGSFVKSFGIFGAPPSTGVFKEPTAISVATVAGGQQIAVVDTVNSNVQFFTTDGAYIKAVGIAGASSLDPSVTPPPSTPVGIAFDYAAGVANRMYILDSFQASVLAMDISVEPAKFLSNIGKYGFGPGQLLTPSDVVYDQTSKRLLVSNGMGNIVSYGIDGGSNPVNSTPPELTVSKSAISVDVPTVTISGTVESGATITSSVNTTATTSPADFPSVISWSVSVSGLIPGLNTVSVTAANQYGNTTTKTVDVTYLPPTVQLTLASYKALTDQSAVTLSGTTEAGSVVTVTNGSTKISGQATVIDTTWVYAASLQEGSNALTVISVKPARSSAEKDLVIELDTMAPVINASLLSDGSVSSTQVLSVSLAVTDEHLESCIINNQTVVLTNGQFNTAIVLNLGDNIISITAVDQVGNSATDKRTISFNPELPQITVKSPVDGLVTNIGDVVVGVEVSEALSVTVNGVAAEPASAGSFTSTVKLNAGINTINISAVDQYNRTVQEKRTVTYDAVAPLVTIASPSKDIATNNPALVISGTVSDITEISSIRATVNNIDTPITLTNGTFTLITELKQQGTHNFAITVADGALNSTTAFRTLVFDSVPPKLSVKAINNSHPTSLTGSVELGATVVVSDSKNLKVTASTKGTAWAANLKGILFDAHTLTVTATDSAGNKTVIKPRLH